MPAMKVVRDSSLYKSEPNPAWFGNEPNPSTGKGWTATNWLTSRFHTSFAEYRGGRNSIGVMRVMNDDLVQPKRGFGTHPHSNMEIVTYIVEGELTHKDSMGTAETLGRGAVQFMSAGTGIRHSEHNLAKGSPLRFIQMWFMPAKQGLTPNYGSYTGSADARRGQLEHVVSDKRDQSSKTEVQIYSDVNIFASELDANDSVVYAVAGGRMVYMLCLEETLTVKHSNDPEPQQLHRHDAIEVLTNGKLTITAGASGTHLLLVEMSK